MQRDDYYFKSAADEANFAGCLRAKCGAVIVDRDGNVIGKGHNSPPLEDATQRTCNSEWDLAIKPKYDKTCCIHAEWNAILEAVKNNPQKLSGSTLYFMRIDEKGEFTDAGEPFCTVCSRLSLQSGVSTFALWNSSGIVKYDSKDYNSRSYAYYEK